ncbi:hypothetical protein ACIGG9_24850 [Pseudonocardia alni]|uniref:hypothetical protein n=1 Tax=Pseudonocardia alni TaxID=33907 RepID=UPI0033EC0681
MINPDIAQKSALGWEAFGTTLRLKWEKMKSDAIGSAAGAYAGVASWWARTKTDAGASIARFVGDGVTKFYELRNGAISRASEAYAGVSSWWSRTKTDAGARISEFVANGVTKFYELRNGAITRASEAWAGVSGWWARTKTDVSNRASELATNAGNRLRELRDNASAKASEIWSSVSGWFTRTRDDAQDRVRTLVDNVGKKWDELKGFFARPIKWVIDYVWNGTIANLWGKARELIPALPEFKRLATGGPVTGYSPTKTADNIPALLTADEFVQPVDSVNYYGTGIMEALRRR